MGGAVLNGLTRAALLTALVLPAPAPLPAQQVISGPLLVYSAGSLAQPFGQLLAAFAREHPGVHPALETSGSVEAVRKLTDLDKVPDLLAVADASLIDRLLVPREASGSVPFARNAVVLAYTARSIGADRIGPGNWWQVLQTPGVRVGHSDPALDPSGYRTHFVYQLAERFYRRPGLADRLSALTGPADIRPKSADLTALLQAGELDYAWTYRSTARTAGLRYVELPEAINLSDPARAASYAGASWRIPRPGGGPRRWLIVRGEPIVYAATVPRRASHRAAGAAFLDFVRSPEGQRILRHSGFLPIGQGRPSR